MGGGGGRKKSQRGMKKEGRVDSGEEGTDRAIEGQP